MLAYLLKLDMKKLVNYRTFWVVGGLYFITMGAGAASGMEFLKWLARTFEDFGSSLNINRIPLYHFPDVWLNLIFCAGLLKVILGILVVISITNEYAYRTVRQNIIDGLSRWQFLLSKILTNAVLSLMSVVLIGLIAFFTGLIYSPELRWEWVFNDTEFLFAYFLEVFFFLSYALMLGVLINRAGLTIIMLMLSQLIEYIITENLDEYIPALIRFFPMRSIFNVVTFPFPRYGFQEIQDYLDIVTVATVAVWTIIFNSISYLKLKHSDI